MLKPTIALIGYGKMGREIEHTARANGYALEAVIDVNGAGPALPFSRDLLHSADVCIEFTSADAVVENIRACAALRKDMVVGTTGWYERIDEVRSIIAEADVGLVYASNFSLGIHLFTRVVSFAAKLLDHYPEYDIAVHETHHAEKKDAPSGTALRLAGEILGRLARKTSLQLGRSDGAVSEDELVVSSTRVGFDPGTHTILIDGQADTIEITHSTRSRRGFAEGALLAASWIHQKKGLYTIEDMMHDIESV